MSPRIIATTTAAAVGLLLTGAVTASATTIVLGVTVGVVAAVMISIKTDDASRPMKELLLEEPPCVCATVEVPAAIEVDHRQEAATL